MIYLDLPGDLNLEDDEGRNVARLADAVAPDAVIPGTVLVADDCHVSRAHTIRLPLPTVSIPQESGPVSASTMFSPWGRTSCRLSNTPLAAALAPTVAPRLAPKG